MPFRFATLTLIACVLSPLFLSASSAEFGPRSGRWAHEDSALKPDSRVTWGRLNNGFRYALLPHDGVPGRVSLRLIVLAGSIDEKDNERGIAHYTEHLSFRASRDFTEEDMVKFFQTLGMEYGSDVNAVTTFDHTAYALDFREAKPELLTEGLRLFRNFADGVSFNEESVNKERGVILSELRRSDNFRSRGQMDALNTIYNGLQVTNRAPIGTVESLNKLSRKDFLEFYKRCYRPDVMILAAVGDFDPTELEKLVAAQFSPMARPTEPLPPRNLGRMNTDKAVRAGIFRVTNLGSAEVMATSTKSRDGEIDSVEMRKERQRQGIAQALLGERLDSLVLEAGMGAATIEDILNTRTAMALVLVNGENWDPGVRALDQMIRATHQRGFEKRELEAHTKHMLTYTDYAADQYPKLDPYYLCEHLTNSITEHRVYVGLEKELGWQKQWLSEITTGDLQKSFQNIWDIDRMAFHLTGDLPKKATPELVVEQVNRGRKGGVRHVRPENQKGAEFELQNWGTPTEAELVREVPEINAQLYKFGNNVRLNFVSSRSDPGLVHAVVRVGSGLLDMPGNEPALKEFGLQTLFASGTAHYRAEQLGEIISDHFLDFNLDLDDHDAFTFRGTVSDEELPTLLGLITEFLYQPRFGTHVHRSEKQRAAQSRASREIGMEDGVNKMTDYLFKGDPRFELGTITDYVGMTSLDVRQWLETPLTKGYVEVTIVGDIESDRALDVVSKTLGSLKTRADKKSTLFPPSPVKVTAPPGFKRIEFVGEQHLAAVFANWPVTDPVRTRDQAAIEILTKILEIHVREQIRDNLGLAYSPSASYETYEGFPNFGMMTASIDCAPSEATRIASLVDEIAARISREGVDEGEFIGSRGILASQVRRAWIENGFILASLIRAQEQPETIEELIKLKAGLIDDITIEEVNEWASRILPASNSRTAAVVPKEFIGIFSTEQN